MFAVTTLFARDRLRLAVWTLHVIGVRYGFLTRLRGLRAIQLVRIRRPKNAQAASAPNIFGNVHDPERGVRTGDAFSISLRRRRGGKHAHMTYTHHAGARGGMQYIGGPKDGRAT